MTEPKKTGLAARAGVDVTLVVLALFGIFLTYQILTRSFAAYLAPGYPTAALRLRPADPAARLVLAEKEFQAITPAPGNEQFGAPGTSGSKADLKLTGSRDPADPEILALKDRVRDALREAPLSARGFAILGGLAISTGEADNADTYMAQAVKLSLRERRAAGWLLGRRFESGNYLEALRYADLLARTTPARMSAFAPFLGRLAETPASAQAFADVIKDNPPWRQAFFQSLKGNIGDARTPLSLLLMLKNTESPPTREELKSYTALLIDHGMFDLAQNAWLQFLPDEQLSTAGFIFNGGFDFPLSESPFDWAPGRSKGLLVDRISRAEKSGDPALQIEFGGGRIDTVLVRQLTLLAPGAYVFAGIARNEIKARRGVKWRMVCAGANGAELASLVIPTRPHAQDWAAFELGVTVPFDNCRAQWLQLEVDARSPSETMITGRIRLDDLKIVRASPVHAAQDDAAPAQTGAPPAQQAPAGGPSRPAP